MINLSLIYNVVSSCFIMFHHVSSHYQPDVWGCLESAAVPRLGESSTVFPRVSHLLLVPFSLDLSARITRKSSKNIGTILGLDDHF